MRNDYIILEDADLVSISCHYPAISKHEPVVVDLEIFERIKGLDVDWRVYQSSGKPYVAGNQSGGKIINLKKLVGDIYYGEGNNSYSLANKKYWDLRKCNIVHFANGYHNNPETMENIRESLETQPKLIIIDGIVHLEETKPIGNQKKEAAIAENNDTTSTVKEPHINIVKSNNDFWITKENEIFCAFTKKELQMICDLVSQRDKWFND